MEESKKKAVMIGVIVVSVVLAIVIFSKSRSGSKGSSLDAFKGELMWVKCSNPDCEAEYQMDKKEYFEYVQTHARPGGMEPLACEKCGENSIHRAVKCPECGTVFFYGQAGPQDFRDRCPKCNYSATEERRKARRGG